MAHRPLSQAPLRALCREALVRAPDWSPQLYLSRAWHLGGFGTLEATFSTCPGGQRLEVTSRTWRRSAERCRRIGAALEAFFGPRGYGHVSHEALVSLGRAEALGEDELRRFERTFCPGELPQEELSAVDAFLSRLCAEESKTLTPGERDAWPVFQA
ncbi:MAG: hypothetical protein RL653_531 [Pseudomonadota bacterium]|jgi:hypothetical protein